MFALFLFITKEVTMGNEIQKNKLEIDSLELLIRFLTICKNESDTTEFKAELDCTVDVVTAVYYFRRYPNVEDFINEHMKNSSNYFQIQWARKIWQEFSQKSQAELSDLAINRISLVANSEES